MTRRRFMFLAVALVALNSFFWLATTGFALPRALIGSLFGPRMIRAEVIVQAPGGAQDWLIDRGVVTSVAPGTITLAEADGRSVTVPLASSARIPPRIARSRGRVRVLVYHLANQPAQFVQVEGTGQ